MKVQSPKNEEEKDIEVDESEPENMEIDSDIIDEPV